MITPRTRTHVALWLTALLSICTTALHAAPPGPKEIAGKVLATAGIPGGVVSHVGCGDGALTAALRVSDRFRVQGLDTDVGNVKRARAHIRGLGLYGKVSVARFGGKRLPYTDNLVNLIVCAAESAPPQQEMMRVLAPGGCIVFVSFDGDQLKTERLAKPWPAAIDEWTHFLHSPDNNAVCRDSVVGIPRSFQWVCGPRWGRSHEEFASMSAAVTARGRIYYIVDEAPLTFIRFASDWKLVARDAFNGTLLWKRGISSWNDHLRHFRSGPAHLPRRLVAVGNTVYVTLGFTEPVTALDGITGKTLRTYKGTERTEEIVVNDGVLYVVVGTSEAERRGGGLHQRDEPEPTGMRQIMAFQAESGSRLWRNDVSKTNILPLTMALQGNRLYYQSLSHIVCLGSRTGKQLWATPRQTPARRMGFSAPTLVATDSVVLCADRDAGKKEEDAPSTGMLVWGVHGWNEKGFARKGACTLRAYNAADGAELWSVSCREGYNSPVDVFVVGSVVWVGPDFRGFDLKTGEAVAKVNTKAPRVGMSHARCYRNKASEQFIFTCKSGIEVLGLAERKWLSNNSWVRGTCQYGIVPANGLIYAPPDACACFLTVKAPGFFAVAPQRGADGRMPFPAEPVLEKGVSYGQAAATAVASATDWPTYRHGPARSGFASCPLPEFPRQRWSTALGGTLTQAAIAGGKVFVAGVDTHTVHALSADDGTVLWHHTAGGRIDSTPSVHNDTLLFGSTDGWVTCLSVADGAVRWRFRAAPEQRLVSVYGQLESAWPVHGAVLVQNDTAYVTAGRSTYLDGGLVLYRLDPATGKQLSRTMLYHLNPETGEQLVPEAKFNMEGTTSDVLSGNGDQVFLKYFTFDRNGKRTETKEPRLFGITGFLGEDWFVRSYWIIGTQIGAGWGGWANAANTYASGRLLCFNQDMVYGYGRQKVAGGPTGHRADAYHLFGMPRKAAAATKDKRGKKRPSRPIPTWSDRSSLLGRALVAGDALLAVAGPPDVGQRVPGKLEFADEAEAMARFSGGEGALLRIVRSSDGKKISECSLTAVPVFDGMSAAAGRLYVALRDGSLVCFETGEGTPLPDPPPPPPETAPTPKQSNQTAKPPPPPAKLAGKSKVAEFAHVDAAGVVESDLGYRVAARKGQIALALRKLDSPLGSKGVFTARLRCAPEYRYPHVYENAFIALGSGTADADLVKCGLKFVQNSAVILTGTAKGPAAATAKLQYNSTKPLEVRVVADFAKKEVALTVAGKTLKAPIPAKITSISHVGYCTTNAVSDFSTITVEGK